MRVDFIVPFVASLAIGQASPVAGAAADLKVAAMPVIAQVAPATSGGITVTGRSTRTVKADTVAFFANVQTGANGDPIGVGDAIVTSLKKDGVTDASWSVQNLSARFGSINVSGSAPVQPPDALKKTLLNASLAAGTAVAQNIQLSLQLRNCSAVVDALRKSALDDARHQAEKIAESLGLRLGAPVSANATLFSTGDRCPSENVGAFQGNGNGLGTGPWNPDGMVTVSAAMTLTFAIAK
jgi:uncharacterized protein YggE